MIIYFAILFVAVMFSAIAVMMRSKAMFVFGVFCALLSITVPAALRYGIGTDYFLIYMPSINWILDGNVVDQEPSFVHVVKTIMHFTDEPHWIFVFYSVSTYAVAITAFPRKGFHCAVMFYLLQYYPFTICDIRQGLALSFVIWTVALGLSGHCIWVLIMGSIAVYWHFSAIVIFPALLAAHYLARKEIPNFIAIVTLVGLALWLVDISELFLRIASLTPYAKYLSHPEFIDAAHTSTGLGYLVPALMYYSLAVVLYNRDGGNRVSRFLGILCGITFLVGITSLHLEVFRRFSIITDSVLPIATAYLWRKKSSVKDYGCLLITFLCVFALFSKEIISNGGYGVVPYTTIFDEGVKLW